MNPENVGQALFEQLMQTIRRPVELQAASSRLWWDGKTHVPPKGQGAHGIVKSRLEREAHSALMEGETGDILARLDGRMDMLSEKQRLLVERLLCSFKRQSALNEGFVGRSSIVIEAAAAAWARAREKQDFAIFQPHLEAVIGIQREQARFMGASPDSVYEVLFQGYEPGMTVTRLREIMDLSLDRLQALYHRLVASERVPNAGFLSGDFSPGKQRNLGLALLHTMGLDMEAIDYDQSAHPFMSGQSRGDCRVTTRFDPRYLPMALFSTMHEGGHAMVEQQTDPMLDWTQIPGFVYSLGLHESQSRLWENLIGRSLDFWSYFYPQLRVLFPQFRGVLIGDFVRGVNAVRRQPIRVQADEVSYNLHVLIRTEIEIGLLSGDIDVADLPQVFADKMEEYLGVRPANVSEGALQDIHWSIGAFGYFPTYMLGNFCSGQLFHSFCEKIPNWRREFDIGDFTSLARWLGENVHRFLPVATLDDLLVRVTGEPLNPDYWFEYVEKKMDWVYQ
ncbi:MAG: carboxypeptidase M32 [bacterium]|nr:carboxypeptidase M32 [bacterium]